MRDPYTILGITKSASADEIKSAYRKLAKKLHPDVNPGRKDIETKFKEVTAAYDLLSDTAKRARYDRGEVDAMGNERGFSGGDPFAGSARRSQAHSGGAGFGGDSPFSNMDDILAEFMGAAQRGKRSGAAGANAARGADATYTLTVPFVEACLGGKRRVTLTSGKTIDVTVPPGTTEGDKLRLRGQGQTGPRGAGDAIIEIHVEPHAYFTRKENDIHLEAPISLPEALLGASIKVPTLDGSVSVKVPKDSNTGAVLRLKGKGIPLASGEGGDMFVKLKITLPEPPSADLSDLVEKWAKKNPYNPREKLGW